MLRLHLLTSLLQTIESDYSITSSCTCGLASRHAAAPPGLPQRRAGRPPPPAPDPDSVDLASAPQLYLVAPAHIRTGVRAAGARSGAAVEVSRQRVELVVPVAAQRG
jgi:hypothetical protein